MPTARKDIDVDPNPNRAMQSEEKRQAGSVGTSRCTFPTHTIITYHDGQIGTAGLVRMVEKLAVATSPG